MTDSASHPERAPNGEPPFPDEADWLDLPCPDVTAGFVEATWQRVQASSADADAPDPEAVVLPRAILDAYTVPPPSPGFAAATWARIRADAWRRALAQHRVPEPSPDFVERVLHGLREQREPAARERVVQSRGTRRSLWLAAAAAALIAAVMLVRVPADASLPFEVLASPAFSPDPWGVALSSLSDRGLAVVPEDAALRLGELVGLGGGR